MCSGLTKYDVARQHADVLRECAAAGLSVDDWRSVVVYDDIMRLRGDGLKMEYCVHYAAETYGMSTAKVWRLLEKMRSEA